MGARLILQVALESEVEGFLGRARHERNNDPVGYRNGYEPRTVKTTAGPLELERPRLRNASALGFCSAVVGKGVCRTHALETLVVCSFLRGLSVRDVEAALAEAFEGPVVSKSTVSRICADTRERYRAWCGRRLDEDDLVYSTFCFLHATPVPRDSSVSVGRDLHKPTVRLDHSPAHCCFMSAGDHDNTPVPASVLESASRHAEPTIGLPAFTSKRKQLMGRLAKNPAERDHAEVDQLLTRAHSPIGRRRQRRHANRLRRPRRRGSRIQLR